LKELLGKARTRLKIFVRILTRILEGYFSIPGCINDLVHFRWI
jgi:hypothetical protein